ncbi:hypothetical protein [Dubosiella newyorkensis]|uniref:hypothetical protein n=1 Tax=Dubosiella newyorkensis TaxID=1862672 RepID=UPI0025ACC650|nr:hypothetical protein [Dubosiella newyorkensis]
MEKNPYVSFVSETTIRFTEEFKEIAYAGKQTGTWYYVKFEDNLNFCFLTNPKKFVPLSIDYGSLSLRTHFLLLFKLPALAAA